MAAKRDIEDLRKFSKSTDRELTPFFAGRKAERQEIRDRVTQVGGRLAEGQPKPAVGSTILITGAPGVGKTSLMDKMLEEWNAFGDDPQAILINRRHLNSAEEFRAELRRQLVPKHEKLLDRPASLSVAGVVSAGLHPPDGGDVGKLARPTVLCVDEIQNVNTDPQSYEAKLLCDLHEGAHGAPVIPVLAGLSNSADMLAKAGISRRGFGSVLTLGRLAAAEAKESAKRFFEAYRVTGDVEDWTEKVCVWSDRWPMHVHNTLRALAEKLVSAGRDLRAVDRNAVRRRAAEARMLYYAERTTGELEGSPVLLGRVMERVGSMKTKASCLKIIKAEHSRGQEDDERLPADVSAERLFNLMLQKGLLQRSPKNPNSLHCPIPSLRSWCAAAAGGLLHQAAFGGDIEEVGRLIADGADSRATDARGRTAAEVAAENGWPRIAGELRKVADDSLT